ncbi:MAG: flagellar protein FlgN [Gammaproteobacteria bacterium]|nr:flagellar protein FlgN [Gammaproteobacteria bacterium]
MTVSAGESVGPVQLQELLERMLDLLQLESQALQGGDTEALDRITAQKAECIAAIGGWSGALPDRGSRLSELASACARLNAENGSLVNAALRGTRKALQMLTDLPQAEHPSAYTVSSRYNKPQPPGPGTPRLFSYSA